VRRASTPLQLRAQRFWLRKRRLASKTEAYIGCGLPIHQAAILKQRNSRGLCVRCSKGDDLEGLGAKLHL
jgi:hypothetical protein